MGSVKKGSRRIFKRVLVANRGEIACRIQRTCHRLGIETIAIGSSVDQELMHMSMADKAVVIEPTDCYLDQDAIIEIALKNGAQAIHPGYGYLSENAGFAQRVRRAGLVFIGPSSEAIQAMGSKIQAKEIAKASNVPVIPGYEGQDLTAAAKKLGFPLLIKATHGGGGKGMRRVDVLSEFEGALAACQREGKAAFGSGDVFLEKYIEKPRHVEVQVLGDSFGKCIALSDRDCSLQRRHQKVIEEAPAPDLSTPLRANLHDAAVSIAQAVSYEGLGTVEFLVTPTGDFYFLEMNTRLQVEHPVTEMILGLDLVEWQLRVAAGEPLELEQTDQVPNGHAIEARLYAEDGGNHFLPSTGLITQLEFPETQESRVDTGFQEGDEITIYYDPMIAKVISWGKDRKTALKGLSDILNGTKVKGIKTNLDFLVNLLSLPDVKTGVPDIGFIDRYVETDIKKATIPIEAYLLTAIWLTHQRGPGSEIFPSAMSPWVNHDGWRLNAPGQQFFHFDGSIMISVSVSKEGMDMHLAGNDYQARQISIFDHHTVKVTLNGERVEATIESISDEYQVYIEKSQYSLRQDEVVFEQVVKSSTPLHLSSPMPGRVVSVMVALNEPVEAGQPLIILEAMKMEHTIRAPHEGIVDELLFSPGDFCEEGVELIRLREK